MHQTSPTDTKNQRFSGGGPDPPPPSGRGVPPTTPSPAPTFGRDGSDLRPLQQGRLLLCQLPLLLFFLLKTLHLTLAQIIRVLRRPGIPRLDFQKSKFKTFPDIFLEKHGILPVYLKISGSPFFPKPYLFFYLIIGHFV